MVGRGLLGRRGDLDWFPRTAKRVSAADAFLAPERGDLPQAPTHKTGTLEWFLRPESLLPRELRSTSVLIVPKRDQCDRARASNAVVEAASAVFREFMTPNVELTGTQRQDALAARRMMNYGAGRPGWHAVACPVERHVRPRSG